MVAIQNFVLAVIASSMVVEAATTGDARKRGLEVRGLNNIWARSKFSLIFCT